VEILNVRVKITCFTGAMYVQGRVARKCCTEHLMDRWVLSSLAGYALKCVFIFIASLFLSTEFNVCFMK